MKPMDFVPSFASTQKKSAPISIVGPTTCTSSAPSTSLQPQPTPQHKKDTEPGVTVGCSFFLIFLFLFLSLENLFMLCHFSCSNRFLKLKLKIKVETLRSY